MRLIPETINGAVAGNYGYDPAVYDAASDAFIHGSTPYRDFILLHPPGILLVDAGLRVAVTLGSVVRGVLVLRAWRLRPARGVVVMSLVHLALIIGAAAPTRST